MVELIAGGVVLLGALAGSLMMARSQYEKRKEAERKLKEAREVFKESHDILSTVSSRQRDSDERQRVRDTYKRDDSNRDGTE